MSIRARLLIALPWILGVAFLGAAVGEWLGAPRSGFRIGAVLGGGAAFLHLRRVSRRTAAQGRGR